MYYIFFWSNYSDLTRPHPKWWFSKGNPLISGKSRLVKYYNLARFFVGGGGGKGRYDLAKALLSFSLRTDFTYDLHQVELSRHPRFEKRSDVGMLGGKMFVLIPA